LLIFSSCKKRIKPTEEYSDFIGSYEFSWSINEYSTSVKEASEYSEKYAIVIDSKGYCRFYKDELEYLKFKAVSYNQREDGVLQIIVRRRGHELTLSLGENNQLHSDYFPLEDGSNTFYKVD